MCHFHDIEEEATEWELIDEEEDIKAPDDEPAEPEVLADGGEE